MKQVIHWWSWINLTRSNHREWLVVYLPAHQTSSMFQFWSSVALRHMRCVSVSVSPERHLWKISFHEARVWWGCRAIASTTIYLYRNTRWPKDISRRDIFGLERFSKIFFQLTEIHPWLSGNQCHSWVHDILVISHRQAVLSLCNN